MVKSRVSCSGGLTPAARTIRGRMRRITAVFSWVAFGLSPLVVRAAESFSVATVLEDTKLYFTAPLRWDEEDWLYFGGTLVAVGVAHQFDHKVRDHFAVGPKAVLNGGEDKNILRDAAPAIALIAGTGLYAAFIRDPDGYWICSGTRASRRDHFPE